MKRPGNEPREVIRARILANARRHQAAERDRLISYQAAVMTQQIEQHLKEVAR
jgi:hypothetical protein